MLEAQVRRPPAQAAAGFSGFARRLWTATSGDADGERPDVRSIQRALAVRPAPGTLPPDLFDRTSRTRIERPYWAGNLNVLLGDRAVERHLSGPLRILPGHTNLAMFLMDPGDYSFRFEGSGASWPISVQEIDVFEEADGEARGKTLLGLGKLRGFLSALTAKKAVTVARALIKQVDLEMRVPRDAERGEIEVHVQRQSDGATALVEFSLDAHAVGPGCYVA